MVRFRDAPAPSVMLIGAREPATYKHRLCNRIPRVESAKTRSRSVFSVLRWRSLYSEEVPSYHRLNVSRTVE